MAVKLSNFVRTKIVVNGPAEISHFGTVDVTTTSGLWKWQKSTTQTHAVCRKIPMGWFFVETGQYCPTEIDALERAFIAQHTPATIAS